MSVGKNIRKYRELLEMTQSDFARRIGVSVFECLAIEAGTRSLTSAEIQRIVTVLGIPMEVLLSDAVEEPAPQNVPEEGGSVVMPLSDLNDLLGKMREQ